MSPRLRRRFGGRSERTKQKFFNKVKYYCGSIFSLLVFSELLNCDVPQTNLQAYPAFGGIGKFLCSRI